MKYVNKSHVHGITPTSCKKDKKYKKGLRARQKRGGWPYLQIFPILVFIFKPPTGNFLQNLGLEFLHSSFGNADGNVVNLRFRNWSKRALAERIRAFERTFLDQFRCSSSDLALSSLFRLSVSFFSRTVEKKCLITGKANGRMKDSHVCAEQQDG